MAVGAMTYLYRRLGGRYPLAFLAVELHTAQFIVAGTIVLVSFYYEGELSEFVKLIAIAAVCTEAAILATLGRVMPRVRQLRRWIDGERSVEQTKRAWAAAVGLPVFLVKRGLPIPVGVSVIPICISAVLLLDVSWEALFPMLFGAVVAVGYAALLHYLVVEAGMRPLLMDINTSLAPRTTVTDFWAVPLRVRLMVALPVINLITGLVVAAITSDGGGGTALGLDVVIAVLVATTISLELTVMLSKSILRPLHDLERAVARVREGDFTVSVPVTTGDELGDLAASFNQMVEGLAERERLREAFGTYLDKEIAEYILSDAFSEEGVEVEVSVLFCDVRDFTAFADRSTPQEVVAALNRLFEVIVPIVAAEGGHVDKFEGDGLLAVFGAPEAFPDHADRAVRAACRIGRAINDEHRAGELRVGIGVNSGMVIAGAVGGAGRLNFSVIGGAVNIAARVEAATRELGDSVLITVDTWKRLGSEFEAESRGKIELKGLEEPVPLYAPQVRGKEAAGAAPAAAAESARRRRLPRPRLRR
jgi:adenylate cyclase